MPQIAAFRGVVPEPAKLADAAAGRISLAAGIASGALARDPGRALYRYHQIFAGGGRTVIRKSLLCAIRLVPWADGIVRRHEAVTPAALATALAGLRANRGTLEPIVAGVRDAAGEIERLLRKGEGSAPTFEATTADGVIHRFWRMKDAELLGKLRTYLAPKKLHVLEGADRYEAMLAYQDELATTQPIAMYSSAAYIPCALVNLDDPALAVAPRHRIVRAADPATATREIVLGKVGAYFIVEKLAGGAGDAAQLQGALGETVAHQPAFVAVFAGEPDAWKLTLKPDVSPIAEGVAVHRGMQKLDPVVIESMFLARALPGAAVTTALDGAAALAQLAAGAHVVLLVRPITVAQLTSVDELGQVLPAGSTAFYPPIAPLVGYVVDADEDLV